MGAINTEDAARRLARVILSDIDLYIRERPKLGESREAQIEEGRRLFASRVTPALVPVFAMVLADRAAGRVNAPAAAPSIPASGAAATVGPVHSAPASSAAIEDETATDPSIFVPPLEDRAPPAPARAARAVVDPLRAPGASRSPPIAARSLADRRPAAPTPAARPVAPALPPPRAVARTRPEIPVRVPPAPAATEAPAAVAQARHAAPPAPVIPTPAPTPPVPPARVPIPRLLAIVSVVAAIVAVFRLFFR